MKTLLSTLFLCTAFLMAEAPAQVVINELMAKNETTEMDEAGEYDDWIELYNTGSQSINLEGYFLSDNPDNLFKWPFPAVTIEGNGYLIIWADEDQEQGVLHTNFKLSALGEILYFFDPSGNLIDEVEFGEQEEDVSYARYPNGTGPFTALAPTFNGINEPNAVQEVSLAELGLKLYPNPTSDLLIIENNSGEAYPLEILDGQGRQMVKTELRDFYSKNVVNWTPGIYIVRVNGQGFRLVKG